MLWRQSSCQFPLLPVTLYCLGVRSDDDVSPFACHSCFVVVCNWLPVPVLVVSLVWYFGGWSEGSLCFNTHARTFPRTTYRSRHSVKQPRHRRACILLPRCSAAWLPPPFFPQASSLCQVASQECSAICLSHLLLVCLFVCCFLGWIWMITIPPYICYDRETSICVCLSLCLLPFFSFPFSLATHIKVVGRWRWSCFLFNGSSVKSESDVTAH